MASTTKGSEAVKVVIRCRPINGKETADGRKTIVEMDQKEGVVRLINPKGDGEAPKAFTFDQVYDWNSTQLDIFDITARPLIDSAMEGYNGTIFAYGQTGTGKSHTMQGRDDPPELRGITPSAFNYVFEQIGRLSEKFQYMVRASYIEIYNEEIRDLLSKDHEKKLDLKESPDKGVYVKDLIQFVAKGPQELNNVLKVGQSHRVVGATNMNADSSRSHSIFTLVIECVEKFDSKAAPSSQDNSHIRMGKLNLVDLAGSERQNKTGAVGDRLKEGIKINMSLTALGNVISALADGKSGHIPYRDSKLTRLLQDSLGGNTKTVMVANIGPADWNYDETLSTLRYANRAKNIQNKPRINEDPKDAMLREFQDEIKRLKALLAARGGGGGSGGGAGGTGRVVERVVEVEGDVEAVKAQLRKEMEAKLKQHLSEEALAKAKAEAEAVARAQFEAIAADGSKTEEQRQRARGALKAQKEEMEHMLQAVEKEHKEKEALEAKIKAMESKVISGGGENLLEKVDELKKRSEDLKREAEITKRQEEEQRRRKQELEMKQVDVNAKFESLEEEVQVKSKQLKKLFEKYQAKKSEIGDLQEQFQREREGLLEDYRILTQQIKLKNLIIACFIPPDYQDRIMQHCHWQDYEGSWNIDFLPYAGNAIRAHQDMARGEEEKNAALGEEEKLANVYFSYSSLEDAYAANTGPGAAGARPGSSGKRPGSANKRPGTATRGLTNSASGRRDPTNIGTLRDSVAFNEAEEVEKRRQAAQTPKARGLVKDTVDPRLRKTVAK